MANNQYAGTQGMPGTQMNGQGGDTALPGVGPIASSSQFVEIPFNGGLKTPHYFDGRLLSAEDLQTDQDATRQRQYWLARASGYGVIDGLVATKVPTDTTQISVMGGHGLTRSGKILSLSNIATFAPIPPVQTNSNSTKAVNAGQFTSPAAQKAANMKTVPAGVYMLAASPTSHYEGQVPMKAAAGSFTTSGIANPAGCGSQWEVEGLHFKVIRLDDEDLPNLLRGVDLGIFATIDKSKVRRNLLAHWCYGTIALQELGKNPFTFPDIYNGVDPTIIPDLTDDDLPLAVFHWNGSAIDAVDMWSVRRRIIQPDALTGTQRFATQGRWKALVSDQRVAENQARFLQFQDELDDLINKSNNFSKGTSPSGAGSLTGVKAIDYFAFLPPAGFLPITPASLIELLCQTQYEPYQPPRMPVGQSTGTQPMGPGQATPAHNWLRLLFGGLAGTAATVGGVGVAADALGGLGGVGTTLAEFGGLAALLGGTGGLAAGLLLPIGGMSLVRVASNPQLWSSLLRVGGLTTNVPQEQATQSVLPDLTAGIASTLGQAEQPAGEPSPGTGEPGSSGQQYPPPSADQGRGGARHERHMTPDEVLRGLICTLLESQEKNHPRNTQGCFDVKNFFDGVLWRINLIGSDYIDVILSQSWHEDAIDLRSVGQKDPGNIPQTIEEILHDLPLIIDIDIVEENLIDGSKPLYVMFHKVLHTSDLVDARSLLYRKVQQ